MFGHVQRKTVDGLVRKSELTQVEGMRKGRVWRKTTLVIAVIKYVLIKEMTKNMSLDCGENDMWHTLISVCVADPD